jgi:hypoxia up-regulated 1
VLDTELMDTEAKEYDEKVAADAIVEAEEEAKAKEEAAAAGDAADAADATDAAADDAAADDAGAEKKDGDEKADDKTDDDKTDDEAEKEKVEVVEETVEEKEAKAAKKAEKAAKKMVKQAAKARKAALPKRYKSETRTVKKMIKKTRQVTRTEDVSFAAEDLVAMTLENSLRLASEEAGSDVKDTVLTVPVFFTQKQRQALLDAAEVAGLNVLSLVNENTAAAVQYGIDLKFAEELVNTTRKVVFYNMGTSNTQVALVEYSSYQERVSKKENKTVGQFEVLAHAYDEGLGGAAFDAILIDELVDQFTALLRKKKHDDDVRTLPRVMARLRVAAEKCKMVLSANTATPVRIESLLHDIDFMAKEITREWLNTKGAPLLERVLPPLKSVLDEAKVSIDDVAALVIVGGGIRVPGVQSLIKSFNNGRDLGVNINGDEGMALGAAFTAANISTQFKVRKLGVVDITPFPVGIHLRNLNDVYSIDDADDDPPAAADAEAADGEKKTFDKKTGLFKRNNRMATRKTVAVSHTRDIHCTMAYDKLDFLSKDGAADPELRQFNVTGIAALMNDEKHAHLLKEQKPRVALSFVLGSSGVVNLAKAEATLEEMVQVPIPAKKKKKKTKKAAKTDGDEKSDDAGDEKKDSGEEKKEGETGDDDATADKTDDADKNEAKKEGDEKNDDADADADADAAADEEEESDEPKFKEVKKMHRFPLKISRGFGAGSIKSMSNSEKKASVRTLRRLTRQVRHFIFFIVLSYASSFLSSFVLLNVVCFVA